MFFTQLTRHLTRAGVALALGVLALGAAPAAAQNMTTLGDGSAVTAIPACPGGGAALVDNFTLQANAAGDTVRLVRIQLGPSGVSAGLGRVEIRPFGGNAASALGAVVPAGDIVDVPITTPFAVPTTQTQYSVYVTPKAFGAVPTGVAGNGVTAKVILFLNMFGRTGSDTTSGVVPFDTTVPAEVGWTSMIATNSPAARIQLNWKVPSDAQAVLVLRDTKPVVDAPTAPNAIGTYTVGNSLGASQIRYAGTGALPAGWSLNDTTGLTANTAYYYKAFVRDTCGNWSPGEPIGPIIAGKSLEGDATLNSVKPMVGILNPISGAVVGNQFKVQARVYSPRTAGGVVQPIGTVTLYWTRSPGGAGNTGQANLLRNPAWGSAADLGVFEPSPVLSLTSGSYTFYVTAANSGGANTNSAVIPVTVGSAGGDGNLLRRDNSSQLCNDCHALPTHSTETTTNKKGIWYTGCRSCHQPHGTTNASLIATEITPPQVAGQFPPTKVFFSGGPGYDPAGGGTNTTTISAATFANGDRTGPCQVCHTRTKFYTRAGAPGDGGPANLQGGAAHYTTGCADCHKHTGGFTGGGCTSCHGTLPADPDRSAPGRDTLVNAAPPRDHLLNTAMTALGVGQHQAHVTGSRFRAPLACTECHTNPGAAPHPSGGATEVTFQSVNCDWDRGGACTPQSAWSTSTPNCSNLYCHGNFTGGAHAAPQWTTATSGSVQCGDCHAAPPAGTLHASVGTTCAPCHSSLYTRTTIDPALHMNGQLDAAGCTGCHGNEARISNWSSYPDVTVSSVFTDDYVRPMPSTSATDSVGSRPRYTATTYRGVGAHEAHSNPPVAASISYPLPCLDCHVAMPDGTHGTNYSTPNINIAATGWNGTTCNNACHSKPGAAAANPSWTVVNGTLQQNCASCHGAPPTTADLGHPNNPTCTTCHSGYVVATRTVPLNTHVDGNIQVTNTTSGCARCHGLLGTSAVTYGTDAAPGTTANHYDTKGNPGTAITQPGVGAHAAHVLTGSVAAATACSQCHAATYAGTTHADGAFGLPWGPLATDNGRLSPSYSGGAAGQCSNVYCHSNANPLGGSSLAPASQAWTVGTNLGCTSCHGDGVTGPALSARHTKHLASGTYNMDCAVCHAGTGSRTAISNTANHVNRKKDTQMGVYRTVTIDGSYTSTVTAPNYSCNSTYCHSDGTRTVAPFAAPKRATLIWNTTGGTTANVDCADCHGGNASSGFPIDTGSHTSHITDATGYKGTTYGCVTCHSATTSADRTLDPTTGVANHVNGQRNVSAPGWVSPTCSTNACHSDGTETVGYAPATWGTPLADDCRGCHGRAGGAFVSAYGEPNYTERVSTSGDDLRNSHSKHVSSVTATARTQCVICHETTVNSTGSLIAPASGGTHLNFNPAGVEVTSGLGKAIGSYTQAGETCSNISCHAGNSASWGGPALTCDSCHFAAADRDDWVINNGTASLINSTEWTSTGHGNTGTAFNEFTGATNRCLYCHDDTVTHQVGTNPFRLRGAADPNGVTTGTPYNANSAKNGNEVCLNCHDISNSVAYGVAPGGGQPRVCQGTGANPCDQRVDSWHSGADHAATHDGGMRCWDCHDPHGDGNIVMIAKRPVRDSTDAYGLNATRVTQDVVFTATTAASNYVNTGTRNGLCQVCHTTTSYWQATADPTRDGHEAGNVCGTCHWHDGKSGQSYAFEGRGDCASCHLAAADRDDWVVNNGTKSTLNSTEWTSTGHGNTATTFNEFTGATDRCLYCHDDGIAHQTGTNPFRLRGAADPNGVTTGTPYNAGSAKNGNEVCLNCHDISNSVAYGVSPGGGQPRVCQGTGANPCDQRVDSWHSGADHAATRDGGMRCWDCHDPHGDGNIVMIAKRPIRDSNDAYGLDATRVAQDVVFTATTAASNYVNTGTRNGLCQVCHTATAYWQVTADPIRDGHEAGNVCGTCHWHDGMTGQSYAFEGRGDCILCHSVQKQITAAGAGALVGQFRRAAAVEFSYTWSHKRSGGKAADKWDCIVCHMEGDPTSGARSSDHGNGTVDLRDPDTGTTIMTASWTNVPAGAGSWTSSTVPAKQNRFSRNLTVATIETFAASVMVNQCLKCHDSNGAAMFLTGRPLNALAAKIGGSNFKPFGTTITYTGQTVTIPSGIYTAGGQSGAVIDVDNSFTTSNASYHPVKGKQNNSYTGNAQMQSPWNTLATNKTAGNITAANAWGFVISCWDCHAYNGASGTLTNTVTAHGGVVTIRRPMYQSNNTAAGNLCRTCHLPTAVTRGHGAGSAAATIATEPQPYMAAACFNCHGSSYSRPPRPIRAEDTHGFNAFVSGTGAGVNWPLSATDTFRPYAFFRNVGSAGAGGPGRWQGTTQPSWQPRTGPNVPAGGAMCGSAGNICGNQVGTYGPGGIY